MAGQELPEKRNELALDLGSAGDDLDLRQLWHVLVARRWVVLGLALATMAVALVITLMTTPIYQASSTIQIERDSIKVINSEALTPVDTGMDRDFYQTQYELLRSRSLALKVIEDLGLAQSDAFIEGAPALRPDASPADVAAREQALVGSVLAALGIEPIRNSRLVRISFESPDPALAARVANAYADVFIRSNIERRFEASSYAKKYLEERLAELKDRLEETEQELVAYAGEEQIVSIGGDSPSLSAQNLSELNLLLAQAEGERFSAESAWRQAASGAGLALPQVLESPLIQGLRQSRATLSGQYQDKLRVYKPDYPEMRQLQAQIAEIDRQIGAEIANIRGSLKSRYDAAVSQERLLKQRMGGLKDDVLDLANRSIRYNILQREVMTNQTLYEGLLQRYKEIGVAGGIGANNISVVDRAEVPGGPVRPSPARNLAIALMLGLGLGILAALGINYMDRRIHSVEALHKLTGLPNLGVVPELPAGMNPRQASGDPRSAFSESYRSVRTALQFATPHGLPTSLLVSSPSAGEGKTTSAAELAHNIALLGRRVVLVDADLRSPSLHQIFGTTNGIGLSNVLAGAASLDDALQAGGEANLSLITSGPLPPNPPELLGGDGFEQLMGELSRRFDVVILDGPPVLGLADAPLLASRVEATLLVLSAGRSRKDEIRSALHRFSGTRASVLGTLLVRYDARAQGEYGYGGYGYFAYGNPRS
ncbi:GumC family protein [Luteimonas vadosa]|uniref:Polysaccharide biosynthesis tyrosine autokinase n=1 Tax=Luteimonas vadosa TaxID=1165507 RepID=A0ABP9DPJ2_9GAMM